MNLKRNLIFVMVAVMVLSLSACDGTLALYIDVEKGDVYKYNVAVNNEVNMEMMGQELAITQDMMSDYSVSIKDVDANGNISLDFTYDAVKLNVNAMGESISYDSKGSEEDNPLKAMVGKGFTAKMTKFGEVTEVEGADAYMQSVLDSIDSASERDSLQDNLEKNFGGEAVTSMLNQINRVLPNEEVSVGDTWENKYTIDTMGKMDIAVTYTLDKVEGETAYVSMKGDLTMGDAGSVDMGGMEMDADIKGSMTGSIKVNKNNGLLMDGQFNQEIEGQISFNMGQQEGIEMPSDIGMPLKAKTKVVYSTAKQ